MNQIKKMSNNICFLLITLLLLTSQVTLANNSIDLKVDPTLSDNEVIVYGAKNYYGNAVKLKLGETSAEALKSSKIFVIRSIKVPSKIKVLVHYADKRAETIYRSKEEINTQGYTKVTVAEYGDIIDSKATATEDKDKTPASDEIMLFGGRDFYGNKVRLNTGSFSADDLKKHKIYTIRSVKIARGLKLVVHYEGKADRTLYSSKEELDFGGFTKVEVINYRRDSNNSSASTTSSTDTDSDASIRVGPKDQTPAKDEIMLFGAKNFYGNYVRLNEGSFSAEALKEYKIYVIRSIKVPSRFKLVVHYEDKPDKTIYINKDELDLGGFTKVEVIKYGKNSKNNKEIPAKESTDASKSPFQDKIKVNDQAKKDNSKAIGVLSYDITGAKVKIYPGKYDHDQIKAKGLRFIQSVSVPEGYEMIIFPLKGFQGKPTSVTGTGKLKGIGFSVIFRAKE